MDSDRVYLLQFLAAVAVREALQEQSGVSVLLKWPNDLVTHHGKVGGILLKSRTINGRPDFIVIGIGINVNIPGNRLPANASSLLTETGRPHVLRSLLKSILNHIEEHSVTNMDAVRIMVEWWSHCVHRNQSVTVKTPSGEFHGLARGIDLEGRIILEIETDRFEHISEGSLRIIQSLEK